MFFKLYPAMVSALISAQKPNKRKLSPSVRIQLDCIKRTKTTVNLDRSLLLTSVREAQK